MKFYCKCITLLQSSAVVFGFNSLIVFLIVPMFSFSNTIQLLEKSSAWQLLIDKFLESEVKFASSIHFSVWLLLLIG